MPESSRRLVLLRHASAEPSSPDGDASRPLSTQGLAEAARLGEWLSREGLLGDVVICSPALRTRATWAAIQEVTGHGVLIEMVPAIYEAGVQDLLEVVLDAGAVSPDARTIVLVGHAPGVPSLAYDLVGGVGQQADLDALTREFLPASAAVVSWSGSWSDVTPGIAHLDAVRLGSEA